MPTRILLISYYYPPMNNGGVQRPAKLTKFLRQAGYEVDVLTHGWLPRAWTIHDGVWRADVSRWNIWNIWLMPWRVWRVWADRRALYKRPFDVWFYNSRRWADRMFAGRRPDIIIATYPSAAALELGLWLSERWTCPLVADIRDGIFFEPTNTMISDGPQRVYYQDLEQRVGRVSRGLVTVSEPISAYYRQAFPQQRVETVTNAYDSDDLQPAGAVIALPPGPKHIVFTGRLSLSDQSCHPEPFFETLTALLSEGAVTQQTLQLHMVGEFTPAELTLMAPGIAAGVIQHRPLVPRSTVQVLQRAADVLLLLTSTSRRGVMTGKIFEYLQAGRPILALTGETAAGETVRETGTGVVIDPEDRQAIRQQLLQLVAGTTPTYQPHGLERFSWTDCARRYGRLLDDIHASPT